MSAGRPTLRIDLGAARANWRRFAQLAGDGEAGATVKADAYGLGADRLAPALAEEGCRTFFVALPQEGAALRPRLPRDAAIYVYNGPAHDEAALFQEHDLRPVLNAPEQIEAWRGAGGGPCALHIDTGMNRLGLTPDQARAFAEGGAWRAPGVELVMSHLACADEPDNPMNAAQRDLFVGLAELFPGARRSLSNSGGAQLGPDYQFDLTRPGIGLYGGQPQSAPAPDIRPVATVTAPILQIREVPAGQGVGYGARHAADHARTLAIVALGYADGLIRAGWEGGYGVLDGHKVPVVGRISMDLTALDVTGLPHPALPGAGVEFLGPALDDFARAAGTIPYEVLTSLGRRFARVYVD